MEIIKLATGNNQYSESLKFYQKLLKQALTINQEAVGADGGFSVPVEYADMIIYEIQRNSIFHKLGMHLTMKTKQLNVTALNTPATGAWVDEAGVATVSKMVQAQATLTAKKFLSLSAITSELIEDNNIDILMEYGKQFASVFAVQYDTQCFRGTGTPWFGILNLPAVAPPAPYGSPNLIYQGGISTSGKVGYDDIEWDDLANMINGVLPVHAAGGAFFFDQNVINVLLKKKDTAGSYLMTQMLEARMFDNVYDYAFQGSYLGFPIYAMPRGMMIATYDTANHPNIPHGLFCNMKTARMMIGTRRDIRAELIDGGVVGTAGEDLVMYDLKAVRHSVRKAFVAGQPSYTAVLYTSVT